MAHWGWYWKYKNRDPRKALCSWQSLNEIDSFEMFRFKEGLESVRKSSNRLLFEIFSPYQLEAFFLDHALRIQREDGTTYTIPIETKSCNYGGFYRFFRCPLCLVRMRKLYCIKGQFQCRKCAKLGYATQRLRPSERHKYNADQIEKKLERYGGNWEKKPPRMNSSTYKRLKKRGVEHKERGYNFAKQELIRWHGPIIGECFAEEFYHFVRSEFYDV